MRLMLENRVVQLWVYFLATEPEAEINMHSIAGLDWNRMAFYMALAERDWV